MSNHPFIVTENISCNDLYENGYRWSPGVDVILLGKKIKDTVIYYQVYKDLNYDEDTFFEDDKETKMDTIKVKEVYPYQKYLDQDPLILSDSIYRLVWGDIKEQQKSICKDCKVNWRNFRLKIKEFEIENFIHRIDTVNYRIIDYKETRNNYSIKDFGIINLIEKDTFQCSIYKDNGAFYFSSTKRINK